MTGQKIISIDDQNHTFNFDVNQTGIHKFKLNAVDASSKNYVTIVLKVLTGEMVTQIIPNPLHSSAIAFLIFSNIFGGLLWGYSLGSYFERR
ncbi:MAG: hypothetical protein ACE5GR_03895 [Nitrosopumilus sp.]